MDGYLLRNVKRRLKKKKHNCSERTTHTLDTLENSMSWQPSMDNDYIFY